MIRELVKDEAFLSQSCEKAAAEDEPVARDLLDTLKSIEHAACLAANQIGSTKRIVAYLDENDQAQLMYNPKLLQALGAYKTTESCLSIERETKVTRFARIKVAYDELVGTELQPRKRELSDWTAQIVQHMIDHCKGRPI